MIPAWVNRRILYAVLFMEGLIFIFFLSAGPASEGFEGLALMLPNLPASLLVLLLPGESGRYLMAPLALLLGAVQWVLILHVPIAVVRFFKKSIQESGITATMTEPPTPASIRDGSLPAGERKPGGSSR